MEQNIGNVTSNTEDVRVKDGNDVVLKTISAIVHTEKLIVENYLGFDFTFIFSKEELEHGVSVTGDGDKKAKIIFSKQLRDFATGGGTTQKMELVRGENSTLLFSLFASNFGSNCDALNVTITFYARTS